MSQDQLLSIVNKRRRIIHYTTKFIQDIFSSYIQELHVFNISRKSNQLFISTSLLPKKNRTKRLVNVTLDVTQLEYDNRFSIVISIYKNVLTGNGGEWYDFRLNIPNAEYLVIQDSILGIPITYINKEYLYDYLNTIKLDIYECFELVFSEEFNRIMESV